MEMEHSRPWLCVRAGDRPVIIPREAGGPENDFARAESLIGTGPFMLKSYTPEVKVAYDRNPDYWRTDRPYVDQVELTIVRRCPHGSP